MLDSLSAGSWFNIKMSSYQYGKSHCGDKTVVRSSYLHNGISYTGEMASLYWFSPLVLDVYRNPDLIISAVGDVLAANNVRTSQWKTHKIRHAFFQVSMAVNDLKLYFVERTTQFRIPRWFGDIFGPFRINVYWPEWCEISLISFDFHCSMLNGTFYAHIIFIYFSYCPDRKLAAQY